MKVFSVCAGWDQESAVWVVAFSDVPGLATEADTLDELSAKLNYMIPELLEANGVILDSYRVRVLQHTL